MTPRYLLDTNIVSFYLRQSSPILERRLRRRKASDFALSVATEMEIRFGLERHPQLRIRPQVEEFLAAMTILPIGSSVARAYAKARAALEQQGVPIGPIDLIIASHALALDLTLVTNNVAEFRRVPGLRVEDWSR